jgi:hypothetical protein
MTRLLVLLFTATALFADVAVPPRMLAPRSAEEAWNVIRLATDNVARLVDEKRPLEIAAQVSLLSPCVRFLASQPVKPGTEALVEQQSLQAFQIVNAIARHSVVENTGALPQALATLRKTLDSIASGFEPDVISGEIYHCHVHSDTIGKAGEKCPQCSLPLVPRRIPYSFIHARPKTATTRLTLRTKAPAEAGKEVSLIAKLETTEGKTVIENQLWPMHTQTVQFLITAPQLAGFHHVTAKAGSEPGEFTANFTPAFSGTYQVRAGLTPATTGLPEYPSAELTVAGEKSPPPPDPNASGTLAKVGGFQISISVGGNKGRMLRRGQEQVLQMQVQDEAGKPVNRLEPLLQAFAHLHAFYPGSDTLLQLHPSGGDILLTDVRGGPALSFPIYSPEPGLLRLFAQLQIDGKPLLATFQLQVHP